MVVVVIVVVVVECLDGYIQFDNRSRLLIALDVISTIRELNIFHHPLQARPEKEKSRSCRRRRRERSKLARCVLAAKTIKTY